MASEREELGCPGRILVVRHPWQPGGHCGAWRDKSQGGRRNVTDLWAGWRFPCRLSSKQAERLVETMEQILAELQELRKAVEVKTTNGAEEKKIGGP